MKKNKNQYIEISKREEPSNLNFLGYDEDHDGNFDNYFMCPKCKENNYLKHGDAVCDLCATEIKWVD